MLDLISSISHLTEYSCRLESLGIRNWSKIYYQSCNTLCAFQTSSLLLSSSSPKHPPMPSFHSPLCPPDVWLSSSSTPVGNRPLCRHVQITPNDVPVRANSRGEPPSTPPPDKQELKCPGWSGANPYVPLPLSPSRSGLLLALPSLRCHLSVETDPPTIELLC